MHAQRSRPLLHGVSHLAAGQVFGQYLQVGRRREVRASPHAPGWPPGRAPAARSGWRALAGGCILRGLAPAWSTASTAAASISNRGGRREQGRKLQVQGSFQDWNCFRWVDRDGECFILRTDSGRRKMHLPRSSLWSRDSRGAPRRQSAAAGPRRGGCRCGASPERAWTRSPSSRTCSGDAGSSRSSPLCVLPSSPSAWQSRLGPAGQISTPFARCAILSVRCSERKGWDALRPRFLAICLHPRHRLQRAQQHASGPPLHLAG